MRKFSALIVLAALASSCGNPIGGVATRADTGCVQPEPDAILDELQRVTKKQDRYFPEVSTVFQPVRLKGREMQWMAASWEAPRSGVLFLLDCAGKPIADLRVGAMSGLRAGPTLVGGATSELPTLEMIVGPGTALGSQLTEVTLVAFKDGAIQILWSHVATEPAFAPGQEIEYSDEFVWEFSADGLAIAVRGTRKIGRFGDSNSGWAAGSVHPLPGEKFCWDPSPQTYLPCV